MERQEILLSWPEIKTNYTIIPKPGTYNAFASGTANVVFDSNLGLDIQLINFKAIPAPSYQILKQAFNDRGDGYVNLRDFGRGKTYPNFTLVYRNILNNGDADLIRKPLRNEKCIIQVDYARKDGKLVTNANDELILNIMDFAFVGDPSNKIGILDEPHPVSESEELVSKPDQTVESNESEEA